MHELAPTTCRVCTDPSCLPRALALCTRVCSYGGTTYEGFLSFYMHPEMQSRLRQVAMHSLASPHALTTGMHRHVAGYATKRRAFMHPCAPPGTWYLVPGTWYKQLYLL